MRTDLRLNYGNLESIHDRISDYHDALENIESALSDLKSFLGEQESEAIDKLKNKLENVNIDIGKKKDTLSELKKILNNYISDMKSYVNSTGGGETRVDTWDIYVNIGQIQGPITDLGIETWKATKSGFHFSLDLDDEAKAESKKLERNYRRLDNCKTGTLRSLVTKLQNHVDDMRDIYDRYLKPYEKTDDTYRSKLNGLYDRHTSKEDKRKNFWESFGSIAKSFAEALVVAAISAFVIALLPGWAIAGLIVVAAAGCAIMANIPEESVPDWLKGVKNAADETAELAVKTLQDPTVLVETIGQGLADTIQTPEGIAALAGTTIGSAAGGYAGSKVKAKIKTSGESVKSIDDIITDGSHIKNGKLEPNVKYQTGEHNYIYQTNEEGLLVKAKAEQLKLKTHEGRLTHNPNTPGKQAGDHAGHLFGDRFGGSPDLDNLVSQAKNVNLSEYKVIENQWAKALKSGQKVSNVNIDIHYANGGARPTSFDISYKIDNIPFFESIVQ